MQIDGKATKTKSLFRIEVGVGIKINAQPDRIWRLLTHAPDIPGWNSTVKSIEGDIALGNTIRLTTTESPRIFKLKVTTFEHNRLLVWEDGAAPMFKGVRRYTLTPKSDATTDFLMVETFTGLMLPMIAGSLPDFRPAFERYAADLKVEAERKS
jgi:hypothetical protein